MDNFYERVDDQGLLTFGRDEVVVTTGANGEMVMEFADPLKEGTAKGIMAEWQANFAWQRAFDNVLEGVDEMIVSAFVNMPNDFYAGDEPFDRDEWNHSVKGLFDAKHHQWAKDMDMSTPWERWER